MQAIQDTINLFRENSTLQSMFSARKRIFVDALGWDVPVLADRFEVDQFDTPKADYIVISDGNRGHRASARLLQTEGPHILADLFPELASSAVPRGVNIVEITRFCIDPGVSKCGKRAVRNQLVSALADHAVKNAITAYTAVATTSWFRQIVRFGWDCHALGPSRSIGGETLVGLQIDIEPMTIAKLTSTGIYTPVAYRSPSLEGIPSC